MTKLGPVLGICFVVVLIACAQVASSYGIVKAIYLPAPTIVWSVLADQITSGRVWAPFGATVFHVLAGWLIACLVGIIAGGVIGRSERARKYIEPTLDFMRPLPASALVPAAILLFGSNANTVLIVTVFGAIWPVLLNSVKGFQSVDPRLIETARMLRFNAFETFRKILLPSALRDVVAGARVSLAIALIVAVVCEMLTSVIGLGNNIVMAARSYNAPDLYAGIVLLGILGIATNAVMEMLEARWRGRLLGSS